MSWKLDLEEGYFRIYDSKKMLAGYFDPDYGDIHPKERYEEIVEAMLKNKEKIMGGIVMVPLVKFQLFDTDLDVKIYKIEESVTRVNGHLQKWKIFLHNAGCDKAHSVRISHTDQDMLTITFPIRFLAPTQLEKNALLGEISPILDELLKSGLL